MSISVVDVSGLIRTYLLSKTAVTDLVGQRVFASKFPTNTSSNVDNESNPKVSFRQVGGSPSAEDYRYTFIVRAQTELEARQIAVIIANQFIQENFSIQDEDGNNLSYWAELDTSFNDSVDDITNAPEVFFNINFTAIE